MEDTSKSIAGLFKIIEDPGAGMQLRINAAGEVLEREAPENARADAQDFLEWVLEQEDFTPNTKFEALKVLRKAEARRVNPGGTLDPGPSKAERARFNRRLLKARARIGWYKEHGPTLVDARGEQPAAVQRAYDEIDAMTDDEVLARSSSTDWVDEFELGCQQARLGLDNDEHFRGKTDDEIIAIVERHEAEGRKPFSNIKRTLARNFAAATGRTGLAERLDGRASQQQGRNKAEEPQSS